MRSMDTLVGDVAFLLSIELWKGKKHKLATEIYINEESKNLRKLGFT